jgi:hypothetical protein
MSSTDETVHVTFTLPRDIYERVAQEAADEQRQPDELLSALVAAGLEARAPIRELLEQISTLYRARLARESQLHQSPDGVMQELRELREQIASDLYPR